MRAENRTLTNTHVERDTAAAAAAAVVGSWAAFTVWAPVGELTTANVERTPLAPFPARRPCVRGGLVRLKRSPPGRPPSLTSNPPASPSVAVNVLRANDSCYQWRQPRHRSMAHVSVYLNSSISIISLYLSLAVVLNSKCLTQS